MKKWELMFTEHLQNRLNEELHSLEQFIEGANAGMSAEVADGDYESLVAVMKWLMAIRERAKRVDTLFEPLQETVELLRKHDIKV